MKEGRKEGNNIKEGRKERREKKRVEEREDFLRLRLHVFL